MGTRSDYYIIENNKIEFIGSYGWDGYPEGNPSEIELHKSKTREEFIENVNKIKDLIVGNWP